MTGGLLATWLGAELFSSAQVVWIIIVCGSGMGAGFIFGVAVGQRGGR
jgi:hypothetical protein